MTEISKVERDVRALRIILICAFCFFGYKALHYSGIEREIKTNIAIAKLKNSSKHKEENDDGSIKNSTSSKELKSALNKPNSEAAYNRINDDFFTYTAKAGSDFEYSYFCLRGDEWSDLDRRFFLGALESQNFFRREAERRTIDGENCLKTTSSGRSEGQEHALEFGDRFWGVLNEKKQLLNNVSKGRDGSAIENGFLARKLRVFFSDSRRLALFCYPQKPNGLEMPGLSNVFRFYLGEKYREGFHSYQLVEQGEYCVLYRSDKSMPEEHEALKAALKLKIDKKYKSLQGGLGGE